MKNKTFSKIVSLMLAGVLAVGVSACGSTARLRRMLPQLTAQTLTQALTPQAPTPALTFPATSQQPVLRPSFLW